jgi:hypothetical protein
MRITTGEVAKERAHSGKKLRGSAAATMLRLQYRRAALGLP